MPFPHQSHSLFASLRCPPFLYKPISCIRTGGAVAHCLPRPMRHSSESFRRCPSIFYHHFGDIVYEVYPSPMQKLGLTWRFTAIYPWFDADAQVRDRFRSIPHTNSSLNSQRDSLFGVFFLSIFVVRDNTYACLKVLLMSLMWRSFLD